jgi:hypothetical protein
LSFFSPGKPLHPEIITAATNKNSKNLDEFITEIFWAKIINGKTPLHLKKQKEAAPEFEAASRFIHDVFSIKSI